MPDNELSGQHSQKVEFSEDEKSLLRRMRNAILVTSGRSRPHVAPVWFVYDAGLLLMTTTKWTAKVTDLRINPLASLCVDDQVAGDYMTLYGTITIVENPNDVQVMTRRILTKYLRVEEVDARWTRMEAESDRVILAFLPKQYRYREGIH